MRTESVKIRWITTCCFEVVLPNGKVILFDPWTGKSEGYPDFTVETGMTAADFTGADYIILTHAHFDHTEGVPELHKALPEVPVYLHPDDAALLGTQIFPALGAPTVPYQEGDTVSLGSLDIQVLHTPGHSLGGVTLVVGNALFTGDTLFQDSMGRTDLPGGSYQQLLASLKRLAQLPGDYHVLPGHMGTSTLEAERKRNYYMREAMR